MICLEGYLICSDLLCQGLYWWGFRQGDRFFDVFNCSSLYCWFWSTSNTKPLHIRSPFNNLTSTQTLCRLTARWPAPADFSLRVLLLLTAVSSNRILPLAIYCRLEEILFKSDSKHDLQVYSSNINTEDKQICISVSTSHIERTLCFRYQC